MEKIRIGIVGYGNLGRGVEKAIKETNDMLLVKIFTRRNPEQIKTNSPMEKLENVLGYKKKIDVMFLCGGSYNDLPKQAPEMLRNFNTVDSFDTHAKISEYLSNLDHIAKQNKKTAIVSAGWDPGLFSINRLYAEAVLHEGKTNTFWGPRS